MRFKSLAFVLVATASVAAAGGGAYLATWQHERSSAPAATPTVAVVPQPVAASGTEAATTQPAQPVAESDQKTPATVASASAPEVTKPRASAAEKSVVKPKARLVLVTSPVGHEAGSAAVPPPVESAQPAPLAPMPPAPTPTVVDPGAQGQRPWPGPPAAPVPLTLDTTSDLPRADQGLPSDGQDRQWEEVVVPAESVIGLQLESSISSEFARVEDRVDARVTRDVRVGGRVAIPAGTHAIGSVVMVDQGGRVRDRAKIGIRFDTFILPDTTRLTINTEMVYREGPSPAGQSSAKIGGATIGGAIIGAILGGGRGAAIGSGIGAAGGTAAALNGDRMPVVLPAGTTMSVRTLVPINMTVER
jgi:hypothetical protein